jgi:hypothetical protein
MGTALQAITCKSCKGDYLVGINRADIRRVKPTSGDLDGDPWIGIGHEQTEQCPRINPGDKIPCPNCGTECIVEDLSSSKGDSDGTMSVDE